MTKDTPTPSRPGPGNDNAPPPIHSLPRDFLMGFRFFSRLPSGPAAHEAPSLNRMAPALPLVSLTIGLGPALLIVLLALLHIPLLLAVVFGLAASALVTGAMSEDALADSFDGLWGGHNAQERLEIMHDSRHGTYGTLAIVLFVAARMSALLAIYLVSPAAGVLVWLAAQMAGRQSALWLAVRLESARADGVGHSAGHLDMRMFGLGAGIALVLFFILAGPVAGIFGVLFGLAAAMLVASGWSFLAATKVKGYTGDLIGACQGLVEIAVLSTIIIFI